VASADAIVVLLSVPQRDSPEEAFEIVVDALPTALNCDLLYLMLPGPPLKERASLSGSPRYSRLRSASDITTNR